MALTEQDKPFILASLKKHLKAITSSNHYLIRDNNSNFSLIYKSDYVGEYIIKNFSLYEVNTVIHSLIVAKKFKHLKESNMSLSVFIEEVLSWVSMCSSMLAYYTDEKYFTSRSTYNLPEFIKREIYNYMKSVKNKVNTNVGTDSEGNTYNNITYNNVIC